MIVDKYKTDLPDSLKDTFAKDTSPLPDDDDTTLEEVDNNPLEDVYLAVKRVLESLHTDPNDNNSPKLFQTVKIDTDSLNVLFVLVVIQNMLYLFLRHLFGL